MRVITSHLIIWSRAATTRDGLLGEQSCKGARGIPGSLAIAYYKNVRVFLGGGPRKFAVLVRFALDL